MVDYRTLWIIVLPSLLLLSGLAAGQENPAKIKAAFLRNFAHYVSWPSNAFLDGASPWHVGILGPDPFGDVLDTTFEGRAEQGRPFKIFRADRLEELPPCQIVFVAYQDAGKRRAALAVLKDRPVLTVGDAPEFLGEGGVIRFQVGERVSMSVNLDQARAVLLTIQTKMLEVASDIQENGELRRMR
ncbi:YfiR family protein [Methylomonas sp. LL1]|uniref:YfiR family protein n=1 Tax=Methylomonas sp. LL1 TaxID=2785785 RepID=UPI001E57453E|nr:YfiR family protein [Methylomonas sp. LL1]